MLCKVKWNYMFYKKKPQQTKQKDPKQKVAKPSRQQVSRLENLAAV